MIKIKENSYKNRNFISFWKKKLSTIIGGIVNSNEQPSFEEAYRCVYNITQCADPDECVFFFSETLDLYRTNMELFHVCVLFDVFSYARRSDKIGKRVQILFDKMYKSCAKRTAERLCKQLNLPRDVATNLCDFI